MKQSRIQEWEENDGQINEYPTLCWDGTLMSKVAEKLRIKEFSKTLFTSQTIQKR